MPSLRGLAWLVVALTLVSAVGSVLTDPYFDRFSENADGSTIEPDGGGGRPIWRIPAVVPTVFVDAVAFRIVTIVASDTPRHLALQPAAPFVPPRS